MDDYSLCDCDRRIPREAEPRLGEIHGPLKTDLRLVA